MTFEPKHKLATIIFADMVGYTALTQKVEKKAKELTQRHSDLMKLYVDKHGGEILQYVGDGTFCAFDGAIKAVNAALEIREVLEIEPQVNLCIGIHVGDVVFEGDEVYDDGINVAARIELLAELGTICISVVVYEEIRDKPDITAAYLGEKNLKMYSTHYFY